MLANLLIAMGGRAAEQILFETFITFSDKYNNEVMFTNTPHLDITTGASNDLKQANQIARQYVSLFGLGNNIGLYDSTSTAQPFLGRDIATNNDKLSDYTKEQIDKEISHMMEFAYNTAIHILESNIDSFHAIASLLLIQKTVNGDVLYDFPIEYSR